MSNKDVKDMIRELRRQGFEVILGKGGHYKVYKDGQLIGTLPHTPSDKRGLLNALALLRRHGFVWQGR